MKTMNLTLMLLFLAVCSFAQNVPSYVPSNGLVGWWPFNGNANDESGNGNNGTVNGATLTSDRFGNTGKAYSFNGSSTIDITSLNLNSDYSISFWVNNLSPNVFALQYPIGLGCAIMSSGGTPGFGFSGGNVISQCPQVPLNKMFLADATSSCGTNIMLNTWQTQVWYNVVINKTGTLYTIFVNGTQSASNNLASFAITSLILGKRCNLNAFFIGKLDDIGMWNRSLSQQEISNLYNGGICYQTITVTDTLLINTGITGFNPVTYENTIRIWPNPTYDHITIDAGDLNVMNGYSIRIVNALGQQMFQSAITQQQFYLDLSTWTGSGIYYVNIINAQGVTIDTRKIVLQ